MVKVPKLSVTLDYEGRQPYLGSQLEPEELLRRTLSATNGPCQVWQLLFLDEDYVFFTQHILVQTPAMDFDGLQTPPLRKIFEIFQLYESKLV